MNLKSHIILTNHISDILEDQIDIKIEREMLELGAVYPDCNLRKRVRIHNIKQVYHNYELQSENIIVKNKNKWGVSFTLGMLSHYVCDSFCLAHNKKMRGINDFKKHVRYENGLAEYIYDYVLKDDVREKVQDNHFTTLNFDLHDFLGTKHSNYLNMENADHQKQFITDVEHAISCSAIVLSGFIFELEKADCPAVEVLHI